MRLLAVGGFKAILGFEGDGTVATEASSWNGVTIYPSEKTYEKTEEKEEEPEEQEEEESMDVSEAPQEETAEETEPAATDS